MTFYAGGYTATFSPGFDTSSPVALGITEDGIELEHSLGGDPIRGDNMGDTVQDIVLRGGDCYLSTVFVEWNSIYATKLFWYMSSTLGRLDAGSVGTLASGLAVGTLILTKVSGPNAIPSTLTAAAAMLAPGARVATLFAPRLRRVPLRMQLLPYAKGGYTQFYTIT